MTQEEKTKTNYTLTFFTFIFVWCFMIFLAQSFYYLSVNPSEWTEEGRFIFSLFGMIFGSIIAITITVNKYNSEHP